MTKPLTILYAVGTGGKAIPQTIQGETPEEFRDALQAAENDLASAQGRESETVYIWVPGKGDVIDLSWWV